MSLTYGTGPFGGTPAGVFNFERPADRSVLYLEEIPWRIRAVFARETVADSRRTKVLHETGHLPVYYFPADDVRTDVLEPTDRSTRCPWKGDASYWSIRAGGRVAENAVWSYPEPIEGAPSLAGHLAFVWEEMDGWFAEDEELLGHARDPYKRIDVFKTTRHVRVSVGGEVVAESRRAKVLFETGLPPRWYVPPDDVRTDVLVASSKRTLCAYKGWASYWSVRTGDGLVDDVVWSYPAPLHDGEPVRDLLCFFNEQVDLEIDGELQERPRTQWL